MVKCQMVCTQGTKFAVDCAVSVVQMQPALQLSAFSIAASIVGQIHILSHSAAASLTLTQQNFKSHHSLLQMLEINECALSANCSCNAL